MIKSGVACSALKIALLSQRGEFSLRLRVDLDARGVQSCLLRLGSRRRRWQHFCLCGVHARRSPDECCLCNTTQLYLFPLNGPLFPDLNESWPQDPWLPLKQLTPQQCLIERSRRHANISNIKLQRRRQLNSERRGTYHIDGLPSSPKDTCRGRRSNPQSVRLSPSLRYKCNPCTCIHHHVSSSCFRSLGGGCFPLGRRSSGSSTKRSNRDGDVGLLPS